MINMPAGDTAVLAAALGVVAALEADSLNGFYIPTPQTPFVTDSPPPTKQESRD